MQHFPLAFIDDAIETLFEMKDPNVTTLSDLSLYEALQAQRASIVIREGVQAIDLCVPTNALSRAEQQRYRKARSKNRDLDRSNQRRTKQALRNIAFSL